MFSLNNRDDVNSYEKYKGKQSSYVSKIYDSDSDICDFNAASSLFVLSCLVIPGLEGRKHCYSNKSARQQWYNLSSTYRKLE